jgi:tellurium resistance protein TerD
MSVLNLEKGQNINLDKGLTQVMVGLGWDVSKASGQEYDLDGSVLPIDTNGAVMKNAICFFNQQSVLGGSVKHLKGDNRTGAGDGDDEQIGFELDSIPAEVASLAIVVNIYDAANRGGQNFGQVNNAYMRLVDQSTDAEIARYDLTEDGSTFNAVELGRLYRHNGGWKFKATSIGGKVNNLQEIADTLVG